ncbi:MAG: response regulator transcription factor [Spirochaetaceae bacterium]|jgi:two-component system alkaline phosphatase synthesis response regulator PhoP|nr:response regulator transcription factor [Spirochaetaceae bacterium]GMO28551.1 MAG: response regulator transcription factor [Termitinemataceae bacterium]
MQIFVVEDDDNIRELLLYALGSAGFKTCGLSCAAELWRALDAEVCLILLDIMLPGEDGITILKKLRAQNKYASIPVIMLTAKSSEYDRIKGLDLGADDYITKPFSVMEVIARVKAVLRRVSQENTPNTVLNLAGISLNEERRSVTALEKEVTLTYKEFELLRCLMRNEGRVLSREQLLERVWGFEYFGESRTVDMHIKTLRQKLGNSGDVIKTVRNVGYKIEDN